MAEKLRNALVIINLIETGTRLLSVLLAVFILALQYKRMTGSICTPDRMKKECYLGTKELEALCKNDIKEGTACTVCTRENDKDKL